MDSAAPALPVLTSIADQPQLALLIAILGLGAGLAGGLFGIGGGLVIIPGLTLLCGGSIKVFQVAALPIGVCVAGSSIAKHLGTGTIEWRWVRWCIPAALLGALGGAHLAETLPARALEILFGCFLAATAARESWSLWKGRPEPTAAESAPVAPVPGLGLALGTSMGLVSSLLGIGGGVIAVPWLRTLGRMPLRTTVATSSMLVLLTSIFATITRVVPIVRTEDLAGLKEEALLAAVLLPGAVAGGYAGAALVHRLPVRVLLPIFIVVLLTFASKLFIGR